MSSGEDTCFLILKYFLIIINVIASIGCVFILFSISYIVSTDEIGSIEDKYVLAIVYAILIALLIFFILGIIGFVKEHFELTLAYAIFETVNMILLFSIGWHKKFSALDFLLIICVYIYAYMIKSREKSRMPSAPSMV